MFNIFSRKLKAQPDPKGSAGARIYHEYFVGAEPFPDGFHWLSRVYAPDGVSRETSGVAKSDRRARVDAIAWAEATKAKLRQQS